MQYSYSRKTIKKEATNYVRNKNCNRKNKNKNEKNKILKIKN